MIGIDVSKASLSICYVDKDTRKEMWRKDICNSESAVKKLLEITRPEWPWVLEPTGRYSQCAAKMAKAAGRRVLLAPPKQAKAFAQSIQTRAKTDSLDSFSLALYGLSVPLPDYPIKSESVEELEELLLARKNLSKSRQSLKQSAGQLPHAKETLEGAARELSATIAALDKRIERLVGQGQLQIARELKRVPGIGPVVSAAVGSRLESKHFEGPDQFVAYCGLDLRVRDSGKYKGQRKLTKNGDAELRRLLYLAAKATLRAKNSPFKAQYEREKAKGLTSIQAICAVSRKMAKLCWSLHHNKTTYNPERVYTKPPKALDN
jgi:Transposase and inactivated derivatives